MRAVWVAVAVILGMASLALGQDVLPPIVPAPQVEPVLAGGLEVSRPLTPVAVPSEPAQSQTLVQAPKQEPVEAVQRVEELGKHTESPRGPLGPSWNEYAYLLWWPKAHPVPPLVTASRIGTPPILDNFDTLLLVGNQAIDNPDFSGGRFKTGWAINNEETLGFEMVYFFLGSRTQKALVNAIDNPRIGALGLPFVNAITGENDVFLTAAPGVASGSVYTTTTTRVQGAEANFVANVHNGSCVKLNGLLGYRFLQVHEGLTVEQLRFANGGSTTIYDEFNAHNRFHGGQLGLNADVSMGAVYCELGAKVALGQTYQVVRIDGATATAAGVTTPGGVYALPSNIGRYSAGIFAVVPEGSIKFGVKLSDSGRFYVGYNFLYLSDAVRPGDQIDTVLNPANIPALNSNGGWIPPDRPRALFNRSEFWAQGLVFGLETRY